MKNIDKKALSQLMKEDVFSPTDCPNFITYKNYNSYRWYARLVAPLLKLAGGRPVFAGRRLETISGESPCETWMIVRYPSHRAMLRMVMNPYYMLINRFRERGVARMELAFTQPLRDDRELSRQPFVCCLHVRTSDAERFFEAAHAHADEAGLSMVYGSTVQLEFNFIKRKPANGPNPLTYPVTAAVGGADIEALTEFARQDRLRGWLEAETAAHCVQLYERMDPRSMLRLW
jgi:uncharacterized protein (DUF1330 family)